MAAPASQDYVALKVSVAALFVQFNVRTRKMVAVAQHCGVREQLVIVKVHCPASSWPQHSTQAISSPHW